MPAARLAQAAALASSADATPEGKSIVSLALAQGVAVPTLPEGAEVQEFTAQATRPTRANALSLDEAERMVAVWRRFPVLPTTLELYDLGIALMRRYRLSYWDSMIVAAAKLQGCETLFSEDMQDGLHIDGLTIRNPFA